MRICQLYIPTYFIVMDIKEDTHILILLGRPFLETIGAIINVNKEKNTFEVRDEKIEYFLSRFMKNPPIHDSCCLVDIINECVNEYSS